MAFLAFLGLFLIKHGLLVHVVDFGYSYSRSQRQRTWYLGLLMHVLLECATSGLLLWAFWVPEISVALLIEAAMLCVACTLERRASYRWLIQMHVLGEVLVLLSYAAMGFVVLR